MSLCGNSGVPSTAPVRSTHEGSPGLHAPSFHAASQYPGGLDFFHESSNPSPSVFLTVVLTITAPQATHPWLLMLGTTLVVAEAASSFTGFALGSPKVQVGLSQVP